MPITPDSDRLEDDRENVEEAFDDLGTAIRDGIADIVIEKPIKSLLVALVAGIVIGRFVL